MKLTSFTPGQRFFRAELFRNGRNLDDSTGDAFDTREEADADGEEMKAAYDPEWQKRHPGDVQAVVREWKVDSVEDGVIGTAHTIC